MRTSFRPTVDVLEDRDLLSTVGPQYAPGVINGHVDIDVLAPGEHLLSAVEAAVPPPSWKENPTPSRSGFIVK